MVRVIIINKCQRGNYILLCYDFLFTINVYNEEKKLTIVQINSHNLVSLKIIIFPTLCVIIFRKCPQQFASKGHFRKLKWGWKGFFLVSLSRSWGLELWFPVSHKFQLGDFLRSPTRGQRRCFYIYIHKPLIFLCSKFQKTRTWTEIAIKNPLFPSVHP